MGLKFLAFSGLLLAVSAFSVEKKSVGSGCVDLLCPDTAMHFGLRNLVNDDTLRTDSCTSCTQCTENGYSLCLRPRDSRASRASGGCSCAHQLAANCHNDLTQKTHPANLTMHLYTACYTDALQRPPQPLAVNENSSVVVTIEPFWLEPYWRHLTVENLTLHYKFNVKVPEHCEGEVESTPNGVHTCVASVHVDLSDSKDSVSSTKDEEDDYEHSDNYDQYDDDLPPEVQFDRDVFAGAKELESYYTAVVRRPRQIKLHAPKNEQIRDSQSPIESDHLKFDLKPELYGLGERFYSPPEEEQEPVAITTTAATDTTTETETKLEKDESATSEELGGTNFFEDDAKKEAEEEKADEKNKESEEDGVVKVNLEDIEPTKLKSQEEEETETTTTTITTTATSTEESETTTNEVSKEEEGKDEEESEDDDDSGEDSETTTVELVEGEESEGNEEESEETFLSRFTESFDFDRVRLVFLITLGGFIICVISALCWIHCGKNCCKKKTSKTSNGYRYTTANQPTPLKPVSRASSMAPNEVQKLIPESEVVDNFRSIVRSGTTFNPNKVELGISVGMGKFGPIYRATFSSYNGSVHDVNVYLLKNITRLSDDQLSNLTSLLKSNISAGAHPNVVSLCGITQTGPDVMLMWEPLHQPTLQGVLRESRCARFGSDPFNFASFLSSERLATMAIGCCNGLEHLLKKNVYPSHFSTSNVLVAERGIVKIGGFGLAEHNALNMASEHPPSKFRWQPPEHFKKDSIMMLNEQTIIWSLGVVLWEIFSLGGTPFVSLRQIQTFIDSMRDGSAQLDTIPYCGEAVSQLLSTCTSHSPEARGDIRTIIKRLECISADAKAQINLCYREDFPYSPIVTQLEQQTE